MHRIQRIPSGSTKRHTSSITLVVLPTVEGPSVDLDEGDLREEFYRGSGRGGQRRNKVSTAVRIVHTPTGLEVHTERGRRQSDNRKTVRGWLTARLEEHARQVEADSEQAARRAQMDREDEGRIFTHNEQRSTVSGGGLTWSWKAFYAGRLDRPR